MAVCLINGEKRERQAQRLLVSTFNCIYISYSSATENQKYLQADRPWCTARCFAWLSSIEQTEISAPHYWEGREKNMRPLVLTLPSESFSQVMTALRFQPLQKDTFFYQVIKVE